MKLYIQQKIFSWFDSFNVFDENGNKVYNIKGKLSWGKCVKIYDMQDNEIGMVKEKIISITPTYNISYQNKNIGNIHRKMFKLIGPGYAIDYLGWKIDGNILEWNYTIKDKHGNLVAKVTKEHIHLTDTYCMNIVNPEDAIFVVMFAVAIDAEKASRKDKKANND